jgi:hypothetical protein
MASNRSILVYWIKENNWSILKETCIKEGSLTKGSVVQAYYLRKVYPAILIAISGKFAYFHLLSTKIEVNPSFRALHIHKFFACLWQTYMNID